MSDELECRHLPSPVWNPARCGKCGAMVERTRTQWTSERPTVPGWYGVEGLVLREGVPDRRIMWLEPEMTAEWRCRYCGPYVLPPSLVPACEEGGAK